MSILLTSKDQEQRFLRIWRSKEKALTKRIKYLPPEQQEQQKNLLMVKIIATIKKNTTNKRLRLKVLNRRFKEKGISTSTEQMINRKDRTKYLKEIEEERTAYNLMPEDITEDIAEAKTETPEDITGRER